MQTNFRSIVICTIISLFLYAGKAKAAIKLPITDTVCCPPDSLKVISTNYPVFCVSWHVATDSNCRTPYGFEIQWRHFGTSNPWSGAIKIYTGGSTVSFCATADTCRQFQWRVRTICDTLSGGTYSNWVDGPRFGLKCPVQRPLAANDLINETEMYNRSDKTRNSQKAGKAGEQQ